MAAALLVYLVLPDSSGRMGLTCRLLGISGSIDSAARGGTPGVELVVAHHSGNLSWVPGLVAALGGANVTVYSKGPVSPPGECASQALHALPAPCGVALLGWVLPCRCEHASAAAAIVTAVGPAAAAAVAPEHLPLRAPLRF